MSTVALAFDYGLRRIGVAVGNQLAGQARALTTLHHHDDPDWNEISRLIAEWQPDTLIIGLPLREDGSEQPITQKARQFMDELGQRFNLPTHAVDERFSSAEAEERIRAERASGQRKHRVNKGDSDAMAAQVILETWLAST